MGLEVDRLEDEGRLYLVSENGGPEGRVDEVRRLVAESLKGDRTLWANFNWDLRMGVEEALDQQRILTKLVEDSELVLKTAILDEWPGETQRQAQVTDARGDRVALAGRAGDEPRYPSTGALSERSERHAEL